jgi:hypothetical protein
MEIHIAFDFSANAMVPRFLPNIDYIRLLGTLSDASISTHLTNALDGESFRVSRRFAPS